jgi:hypothetical protein
LGPLQELKKELSKQTKSQDEEMGRQRRLLEDIQGEVDLFIGAYLKQDSLEKDKKEEYESICLQMEEMQKELRNLKADRLILLFLVFLERILLQVRADEKIDFALNVLKKTSLSAHFFIL